MSNPFNSVAPAGRRIIGKDETAAACLYFGDNTLVRQRQSTGAAATPYELAKIYTYGKSFKGIRPSVKDTITSNKTPLQEMVERKAEEAVYKSQKELQLGRSYCSSSILPPDVASQRFGMVHKHDGAFVRDILCPTNVDPNQMAKEDVYRISHQSYPVGESRRELNWKDTRVQDPWSHTFGRPQASLEKNAVAKAINSQLDENVPAGMKIVSKAVEDFHSFSSYPIGKARARDWNSHAIHPGFGHNELASKAAALYVRGQTTSANVPLTAAETLNSNAQSVNNESIIKAALSYTEKPLDLANSTVNISNVGVVNVQPPPAPTTRTYGRPSNRRALNEWGAAECLRGEPSILAQLPDQEVGHPRPPFGSSGVTLGTRAYSNAGAEAAQAYVRRHGCNIDRKGANSTEGLSSTILRATFAPSGANRGSKVFEAQPPPLPQQRGHNSSVNTSSQSQEESENVPPPNFTGTEVFLNTLKATLPETPVSRRNDIAEAKAINARVIEGTIKSTLFPTPLSLVGTSMLPLIPDRKVEQSLRDMPPVSATAMAPSRVREIFRRIGYDMNDAEFRAISERAMVLNNSNRKGSLSYSNELTVDSFRAALNEVLTARDNGKEPVWFANAMK